MQVAVKTHVARRIAHPERSIDLVEVRIVFQLLEEVLVLWRLVGPSI
jgi:hypothetical protein